MLFLDFATARLSKQPRAMKLQDITPALILAFLDHLEQDRGNAVRTRNAPLAALRAWRLHELRRRQHQLGASASQAMPGDERVETRPRTMR